MTDFFHKLGLGLKKTSDKIGEGLKDIFLKKKVDSQTLEDLEDLLLTSDIGVQASQKIIAEFSAERFGKETDMPEIKNVLAGTLEKMLLPMEATWNTDGAKPCVILMVGVNGAGKTTTIGKLASKLVKEGKQVSLIAADTFRAAAVEQLCVWSERAHVRIFSGPNGCDSAGLCYDGLKEAIKQGDDVVFIDTAGRLQNKADLMDELKKIVRVIQKIIPDAPHQILLTIDATTGQNALSQVKTFKEIVPLSGLVVTKLDGSAKGGILVAVSQDSPLPVYFIGVGEQIEDLDVFNASDYAKSLLGLK